MNYDNILVEIKERICYITINRPKQLNALNSKTISELNKAIIIAEKDEKIRCIILTGSGEKAFVAGADIKEFISFDKKQGKELSHQGQEMLFDLLENSSTPSIALINGFALGGGLELALSCHIRIASDNSKMGFPEVSLGVIPGYGGTQRLAQLIGKGKAFEIITTARMIGAKEAIELGLVNYLCTQKELKIKAESIAKMIKQNSPTAISKAIKSINACFKEGVNGYDVEKELFGSCFKTKEFIEGTKAFIEKRKPNF